MIGGVLWHPTPQWDWKGRCGPHFPDDETETHPEKVSDLLKVV